MQAEAHGPQPKGGEHPPCKPKHMTRSPGTKRKEVVTRHASLSAYPTTNPQGAGHEGDYPTR